MRIASSALFLFSLAVIVSAKRHYPRAFQVNHFERRGIITYYTPSNDACSGKSSSSSDMVAALGKSDFGNDKDTEKSPVCGRCAEVTGPLGSVVVKIVDKCESCNSGHIDLSPAAFDKVAKRSVGELAAQWKFVDCSGSSSGSNTTEPATSSKDKESDGSSDTNGTTGSDSNIKKGKGHGKKKDSGNSKTEGDSADSSESNSNSKDNSNGNSKSDNNSDSGKHNGDGKSSDKKSKGKKKDNKEQNGSDKSYDDSKKSSDGKKQKNNS